LLNGYAAIMHDDPTDSDADTALAAHRLSIAITRLRSRLREEAGLHQTNLSVSQLSVLRAVVEQGPITAARLADLQYVSPQSISQNLAVLKAAGLVRGIRDPKDGRKTLVTAEESAGQLLANLFASQESFLARAIDHTVSPGELDKLMWAIDLLERFAAGRPDSTGAAR
jgi:DNA-binding MarR family transcriptional regulator